MATESDTSMHAGNDAQARLGLFGAMRIRKKLIILHTTFSVVLGAVLNGLLLPAGATPAWDCAYECSRDTGDREGTAWTTTSGYMLGVILSATDPVAVVALLKELGVKAELSIGIEGESLLNDGTALVIYQARPAAPTLTLWLLPP